MAIGNEVTIVGNVTKDPESRFTKGGASVCSFSVAYNHKHLNKSTDEWEEEVSYFDVTCWATLADNVADSIQKGDRVVVVGRLEQETWEDKDTGAPRSRIKIVADEVCPSLRWASVEIIKNERVEKGNRKSSGGGASRGSSRGGGGRPSFDDNEEPF